MPFEVPSSWVWTTLSEVGTWQSGGTPSRSNKSYYGGNIPWLKTGDLNDGLISNIPESITEEAVANSSAKINPTGSMGRVFRCTKEYSRSSTVRCGNATS